MRDLQTVTLFRPTGQAERDLVEASGWRAFPPRLPEQPIFYPVLTEEYAGYTYDIFEKCRAMENQVWFVSSDHVGVDPKGCFDFYGHSRVIHPSGLPLVEIGKEEGLAIAHGLDIRGEVLRARTKWFFGHNLLADRVPELYREVVITP